MGYWGEVGVGFGICLGILLILKFFVRRYDKDRQATLGWNIIDFEKAISKNNIKEINRLGARIANNPSLETGNLRTIMLALAEYKKSPYYKKGSLKKVEGAIATRQFNWGLFVHRFTDPKEQEEAAKDIINLH